MGRRAIVTTPTAITTSMRLNPALPPWRHFLKRGAEEE
jgi:hypothetical protein